MYEFAQEFSLSAKRRTLAFRALGLLQILIILAVSGCSYVDNRDVGGRARGKTPSWAPKKAGIYHVVRKGENLYRIGKAYGIDHVTLARINRVADARAVRVGRRLFIPGATRRLPVQIITPIKEPAPRPSRAKAGTRRTPPAVRKPPAVKAAPKTSGRTKTTARTKGATGKNSRTRAAPTGAKTRVTRRPPAKPRKQGFTWPVKGKITARFDSRHDSLNDGIDIAAASGTPVRATLAGQVIYSDHLRGYGNLIIVRHRGRFASVYAHNRKNYVRQGQRVSRRQVIAEVGATGRVTTPLLHFEIRRNNVARNPLSYLP